LVGAAAGFKKGALLGDSTPLSVAVNSERVPVNSAFDAALGSGAIHDALVGEVELHDIPVRVYVAVVPPDGVTYNLYVIAVAVATLATSVISHRT
jgi:hypothetical protein